MEIKLDMPYMKGEEVKHIQERLIIHGYKVSVDEIYGPKSAKEVEKFQKANGLPVTGIVDDATMAALNTLDKRMEIKLDNPYMRGEEVKHVQERLIVHGYKVSSDGVYGPKSVKAVEKFQNDKGFPTTGIVDNITMDALNMAPDISKLVYDDELINDATCWLRMMVGDEYIIGAQGHEVTADYVNARAKDRPGYFTGGRKNWMLAEVSRANSLGRHIYAEDCSGLFMKLNEMIGLIDINGDGVVNRKDDTTANGMFKNFCKQITANEVRPLDIFFRVDATGKAVHMAVLGSDGLYEAAGTAYGVVFRPFPDIWSRKTYNRMTGKIDNLKKWTHYGRLKIFIS